MPRNPQPTADEDFWVERGTRYLDTVQRAMDIPRSTLDPSTYRQLYNEVMAEWFGKHPSFPLSDGKMAQDEFYVMVDAACASLETLPKDDWRGVITVCCAAQAGFQAVIHEGFQFPQGSTFRERVWKRVVADVKVLTGKRLQAHREAAGHAKSSMALMMQNHPPEALGLKIDEIVAYIHPQTDETVTFTLTSFGANKTKGRWFTISYTDDPDVEVELTEEVMKEMLATRVKIEEPHDH